MKSWLVAAPAAFLAFSVPALSQSPAGVSFETGEVVYDRESGKVATVGGVKVDYGRSELAADRIEYDTESGLMSAEGKVGISGPESQMTADGIVMDTKTKDARVGKTEVSFNQNASAKSESAELIGGESFVLRGVEYTACREGLSGCGETPAWKIAASRVDGDLESGSLSYMNAFLYMWDVPVAYLPYLRGYMPHVKNKSGLLVPVVGTSTVLGTVYRQPLFVKLNDYNDVTIAPEFTSKKGTLFIGEYRTNQDFFTSETSGSFKGAQIDEGRRWNVKSRNYFEINDVWRGVVDIEKASDGTYLRLYDFSSEPWLMSRYGLEGVYNRSYLTMNAYTYQDLRDMPDGYSPAVMPVVNYRRISEPNSSGGFFDLNLNSARITEDYVDPAVWDETNFRTSAVLKYFQPVISPGGHMFNFGLFGRGDAYVLDNISVRDGFGGISRYSGTQHRGSAGVSADWKYPLFRRFAGGSQILEPRVEIISSPKEDGNPKIPNMDSKYMELELENLFSDDRFSGYDIFESGTRVNYGLKFRNSYADGRAVSFFVGQNYNVDVPDDLYLENSGLANTRGFSDVVVGVDFNPLDFLRLGYKSRMSHETLRMNRNDLHLYVGRPALNLAVNYVYLRNMYIEDGDSVRKDEINAYLSSRLTRFWSAYVGNRYDLYQQRDISIIGGIAYENDCFKFNVNVINQYTRDRDYVGDRTVALGFTFKTLGTISTGFGLKSASRSSSSGGDGSSGMIY
ncbi:MAG: LPS assembly protein LptD [Rickettsiales bacterium]|jgi:LPS-assembly protein|nr:LPS assembly protein LptD [Rickettsiales bacterium]